MQDYDMIVVLNDFVGPLSTSTFNPDKGLFEAFVETNDLDMSIYHQSYWAHLISENSVRPITCQCLPPQFILKEDQQYPWTLNYMKLKHEVYSFTHEHEEKAISLWRHKHKDNRARKTIIHGNGYFFDRYLCLALREMLHAMQIAKTGQVNDISEGNSLYWEIMQLEAKEWVEIEAWYKPIWLQLEEKFKSIVNVYKEFIVENKNEISCVNYLKKFPENYVKRLELELAIQVVKREDFPSLYEFHTSPPNTPCRSEEAKECCGLVLEKTG